MISNEELELYTLVPVVAYESLQEKLEALNKGEILLLKEFEQATHSDVLVRLFQKKYVVTQISYDLVETEQDPRYWTTYNVGFNDLSLSTAFQFNESLANNHNKFNVDEIVEYTKEDGTYGYTPVEALYKHNIETDVYAYKLYGEPGIYAEEEIRRLKQDL